MQVKRKLKPFVIPMLYCVVTVSLLVSLMILTSSLTKKTDDSIKYVTASSLIDDTLPVNKTEKQIIRPYIDNDVLILQNFYDPNAEKSIQEKSLIYYEGIYLQNSGVDYGKESVFDIVSIYDGNVIKVYEDNILGNIIEVQYSNNMIASYQCLSEIQVKLNDNVSQGQIIGKSGTCNISKDIGNHLHFEVSYDGKIINPETIYDKSIKDI